MVAVGYLSRCAGGARGGRGCRGMGAGHWCSAGGVAGAGLIGAAGANLCEAALDRERGATVASNVDNEVISTPAESGAGILVTNLESIAPTDGSHLSFMARVIVQ